MAKESVGFGIVGWGGIAKVHTLALGALPVVLPDTPYTVQKVAVVTRNVEQNRRHILNSGYQSATSDFDALLNDAAVDAVDICTPNNLHPKQVISAWRAGKAVYCEKPLANTYAEASEMHAEWASMNKVDAKECLALQSQVAFVMRFLPAVARAKDVMASGGIGRVLSFRARMIHGGYLNPNRPMSWRLNRAQSGGGALADLGIHMIDLVHYLLGQITEVDARTRTFVTERRDANGETVRVDVDDWAEIACTLDSGAVGTIEASRAGDGQEETTLEIFGTEGSLRISANSPYFPQLFNHRRPDLLIREGLFKGEGTYTRAVQSVYPTPKLSLGWMVDSHLASLAWWLNRVAQGYQGVQMPEIAAGINEGMQAQAVLHQAYLSAEKRGG